MAYVAIGILFLLIVGAGVTTLLLANTRNANPATAEGDVTSAAAPFAGRDHTPLGDTAEHAGKQDGSGRTGSQSDADRGGTGAPQAPRRGPTRQPDAPSGGRFKRDPVGGEAEGKPTAPVGEVPKPRGQ